MFKIIGMVLIIVALVLAIAPAFTDCQSQDKVITLENGKTISMKCHWAGRAEIGVAVPLGLVGIMMALSRRRRENRVNLSVLGIALGALAILFPTVIIGVCMTPTMTCVTAMEPTLIAGGAVAAAASLVALVLAARRKDTE
jgi:hypothetical protein